MKRGFLGSLFATTRPADDDDRWYPNAGFGPLTPSGQRVSPESAMRVSAVFSCVRVRAEAVGALPLITYERLQRGKRRAPEHRLYELLHDLPNPWQTSIEWRGMMEGHLTLRGNAYSEIVPGPRGFADALIPLHPDRVKVDRLPSVGRLPGKLRYKIQEPGLAVPRVLLQDEVFHLRGLSSNGITGLSIIEAAAESIGATQAAGKYGAAYFRSNASPGGFLKSPKTLKPETAKRLAASWAERASGEANWHKTVVLEDGLDWVKVGLSAKDSQLLELLEFGITDIARWFRVPPHMIADLKRSTNNNIEHQGLEFVVHSMAADFKRWEQAIYRDLILPSERARISVEFLVDGYLRGDSQARAAYITAMINAGVLTPNEAREMENRNPIEGLDEALRPLNMTPASAPPQLPGKTAAPAEDDRAEEDEQDDGDADQAAAAVRMVRSLDSFEKKYGAKAAAELVRFVERRAA